MCVRNGRLLGLRVLGVLGVISRALGLFGVMVLLGLGAPAEAQPPVLEPDQTGSWAPSPTPVASQSTVGDNEPLAFLCVVFGVAVMGLTTWATLRARRGPPTVLHVSRLSIGVDEEARALLEEGLPLEGTGPADAQRLRQAVLSLRRAEPHWGWVAHETHGPLAPAAAERELARMASATREARATGSVGAPREDVLVVHLMVAAQRAPHVPLRPDASQLRLALDSRAALTASQVLDAEITWSVVGPRALGLEALESS